MTYDEIYERLQEPARALMQTYIDIKRLSLDCVEQNRRLNSPYFQDLEGTPNADNDYLAARICAVTAVAA